MGAHEIDEEVAKTVGWTRSTFNRTRAVFAAADNPHYDPADHEALLALRDRLNSGGISVWAAYLAMRAIVGQYMMTWGCAHVGCDNLIRANADQASRRRYCSDACRQAAYRDRL